MIQVIVDLGNGKTMRVNAKSLAYLSKVYPQYTVVTVSAATS